MRDGASGLANAFQISSTKKSFLVYADSPTDKRVFPLSLPEPTRLPCRRDALRTHSPPRVRVLEYPPHGCAALRCSGYRQVHRGYCSPYCSTCSCECTHSAELWSGSVYVLCVRTVAL